MLDEGYGVLREHVGGVVVGSASEPFDHSLVVDRVVREVLELWVVLECEPPIPSRWDACPVVAVQVLPEKGRSISGGLQPGCDRRRFVLPERTRTAVRRVVRVDARRVRVLAGQDARPGRATHGGDEQWVFEPG